MEFLNTFSVIFIFCNVIHCSGLSLVEPISFVLQRNLNMSLVELESKCNNNTYTELEKLKIQAASFSNNLQLSISSKLPNPKSNDGLDKLINNDCVNNSDLKSVSQRVVQNVQKCLGKNWKLDNAQEEEIANAIVSTICGSIRISIEWQIQVRKVMENQ